MKRHIYLVIIGTLLLCLWQNKCLSQTLITSGKAWTYAVGEDIPVVKIHRYSVLKIGNDTLISGQLYKKLLKQPYRNYSNTQLYGFLRETVEKKVFFRSLNGQTDLLLYDFSLVVKDSTYSDYFESWMIMDSITIDRNGKRNYYLHYRGENKLHWIEGVGAIDGLLMQKVVGGFELFTCCSINGEIIYHTNYSNGCDLILSKFSVKNTQQITLTSTGNRHLKACISDRNEGIMELYNSFGVKVMAIKLVETQSSIQMPLKGVFFYRFLSSSGVQTGKVLVR